MTDRNQKMVDRLESLQFVAPDAEVITAGSIKYKERKELVLKEIKASLAQHPEIRNLIKEYEKTVRAHSGGLSRVAKMVGLGNSDADTFKAMVDAANTLDNALDPIEEKIGMDIKLGDIRSAKERRTIFGDSPLEPEKRGEAEVFCEDLVKLIR